jgi:hypothetical protein
MAMPWTTWRIEKIKTAHCCVKTSLKDEEKLRARV